MPERETTPTILETQSPEFPCAEFLNNGNSNNTCFNQADTGARAMTSHQAPGPSVALHASRAATSPVASSRLMAHGSAAMPSSPSTDGRCHWSGLKVRAVGCLRSHRAAPERFCSHMRDEVPIITAKALPMLTIEVEQEIDGRWIAEVLALPGVMVYGATETEARSRAAALACRVIADRIEHGEPIPDEARDLFTLA